MVQSGLSRHCVQHISSLGSTLHISDWIWPTCSVGPRLVVAGTSSVCWGNGGWLVVRGLAPCHSSGSRGWMSLTSLIYGINFHSYTL